MHLQRFIVLLGAIVVGSGSPLHGEQDGRAPAPAPGGVEVPGGDSDSASEQAEGPAEGDETERLLNEARSLVVLLGDESYRAREEATKGLWDLGEVGIVAIEEGVQSDDPEVAHRSRILLRRIMTGITPDTPAKIVDLVQRYFSSDLNGKKSVFQALLEAEAYLQMLRIYRFEKNDEIRLRCVELVEKAVLPAAIREIAASNLEEAEKVLRLAPASDPNRRRLACLLRVQEKLGSEIAQISPRIEYGADGSVTDETRELANRRLSLLRSLGRHEDARVLAQKLGRNDIAAVMALFEGDPAPYLRWYMDRPSESPIVRAHAEIVLKRWELDHEGATRLQRQMAREANGGVDERREAMLSLLLSGDLKAGLPLVFRSNKDSAFSYYETVELPQEAVKVLNYGGTADEKAEWLGERYGELRGDWPESEEERYEVLTIASFLYTRGERTEALQIMKDLSEIAWGEGRSNWLEFIGRLNDLGGSLYELAFYLAAEKLTPDTKERDELRIVSHLFGEGDSAPRLWGLLAELEKEKDKRIVLLGALYGFVHLEETMLVSFFAELAELVGREAPRVEVLSDLLEAAEARDDAAASIDLLQKIAKLDNDEKWGKKLAAYHAYVSDWQTAITAFGEILEEEPTNLRYQALYGGALIRAGRDEEAKQPLRIVETFSLDEPIRLLRMAIDVERSGAIREAEECWRKLMMTNGPTDWYWQTAASYYAKHARHNKQWRIAAAFAEVDAMQYLKGRSTFVNPVSFIRKRFLADLYRGLALHEEGDTEEAMKLLRSSFEILNGDGILADDYFPLLREAGITEEHDRNFRIVYERLQASIDSYPLAHNTYNSAAWMASRACRELPDAHRKIEKALSFRPRQAAYLDTMAEVWFARGNREKAVEWSQKAVRESFHGGSSSDAGVGLREQFDRFQFGEFPVK